ncbi:MAG: hypothetical protein JNM53_07020 [Gemmatimonadetes bacterium]|nr:hypothetical protein [Gemmatimonadota bacterium]
MRITCFLTLGSLLLLPPSGPARDPDSGSVLGWWHGTSTCVPAPWNQSCHDEEIVYHVVPAPPDSSHALLHASKIVQGQLEPMGDQELTYVPARHTWEGDFTNTRVSIRWSFAVRGDTLIGQLRLRPDMRLARNVVAQRATATAF